MMMIIVKTCGTSAGVLKVKQLSANIGISNTFYQPLNQLVGRKSMFKHQDL